MSAKKPFRPKARRPRGFEDRSGSVLRAERHLIETASRVYDDWGFEPLQTPAFEFADALGKFLPDEERPNEGVFALEDDDGQWLSLRYDHTAPLARFVAENFQDLNKPYRRYQAGDVWRNEKPGPGRFRQFVQCDADTVGAPGPAADAEMIALAAEVMRAVGLNDGEYLIRVNDRRLLDAVLEMAGVDVPETKLKVMRALDKYDRLGRSGVEELLGSGRRDESGDFTQGAGLSVESVRLLTQFIEHSGGADTFSETFNSGERASNLQILNEMAGFFANSRKGSEAIEAIGQIESCLSSLGVGEDRWRVDTSIVRGLGYYTGPVYEAELLATAHYDDGKPIQFGSVGGGGRYDDLVSRFTGQAVPATGFSFGVSRFAAALSALGRVGAGQERPLVIVIAAEKDQSAHYLAMAAELRAAGFRAEAFAGGGNMGKQMKYADRRGAVAAVIVGSDEREQGLVTIKDLKLGARLAAEISDNREWREEQPAQITVASDAWVEAVRTVARRDGNSV
ncbi:histidine--tRNA ligase [Maricaulis sp.]|uniref:histidine--tRNA ligase n=1 Tax=Maricaulis sp. TaxID=1486257 RepID=UPI003A8C9D94